MPKLQVPQVTHASTDLEIIEAIEAAGSHKYPWRYYDQARPGDNNPLAWIIPNDIGFSSRRNPRLLRRLHKMVEQGILECSRTSYKYQRYIPAVLYSFFDPPKVKEIPGMPRFRVAKGARELLEK